MRAGVVIAVVGVAAVVVVGIGAQGAHGTATQLRSDLATAGYKDVKPEGIAYITSRATAALHGCTVGFQSQKGSDRKVGTTTIHHYEVSSVANGAWVVVDGLKAKTPTPPELADYMKGHHDVFPCYK